MNYSNFNNNFALVVEGKTDKDLISSFLDCEIVTTNGSAVPEETIEYIKKLSETKTVIVLTDPDSPGKRIRDVLNQNVPGLIHAYVPKSKCIKKRKVGVAESDKETIMQALENLIPATSDAAPTLTYSDMFDLGLLGDDNSSSKRVILEEKFKLGHTNAKSFVKRCNCLRLTKDDLKRALNE